MAIIRKRRQELDQTLPVPSDGRIATLSAILAKNIEQETIRRRYAPIKHILTFIGIAGVVGLSLVAPTAAQIAKPFLDEKNRRERNQWKQYNPSYVRSSLRRLHKLKYVEISSENGQEIVTLTKAGRRRIYKYALDELTIEKPKQWDGRWRMIIYDVEEGKKYLRDVFRDALRTLGFYKLQESVWIFPYPCEDQITFLREYYAVGNEVLYAVAIQLEDDAPYQEYFGLT